MEKLNSSMLVWWSLQVSKMCAPGLTVRSLELTKLRSIQLSRSTDGQPTSQKTVENCNKSFRHCVLSVETAVSRQHMLPIFLGFLACTTQSKILGIISKSKLRLKFQICTTQNQSPPTLFMKTKCILPKQD